MSVAGSTMPPVSHGAIRTGLTIRTGNTTGGGKEKLSPRAAARRILSYFFLPAFAFSPDLAELTRALKSAPGRNFGTEDAATWIGSPVAGLRAVRAGRSLFSKTPKPVIATLSPLATAA